MPATLMAIDGRSKVATEAVARPADFTTHEVGTLQSSQLIRDPTLSLYCLDLVEHTGLFVRTPAEVDLTSEPFLWLAQFTHATQVISVPFPELHRLAAGVHVPSERLVFVYSTGRCGSTLACLALAAGEGVVALSEPDVYLQLQQASDRGQTDVDELLKTCTTLLFAAREAQSYVVKCRSQNIQLADHMLSCFPEAKTVFLYRRAESWARSVARVFGVFSPAALAGWDRQDDILPRVRSSFDPPDPSQFSSPVELVSWMWAAPMTKAIVMQRAGVPMFIARYEDLRERPVDVLTALAEYCDVHIDPDTLLAVVARDSQEGTGLSRGREVEPGSELTDDRLAAIKRGIEQMAPGLDPDVVIAGTYGT